jgi:hypothetical protein
MAATEHYCLNGLKKRLSGKKDMYISMINVFLPDFILGSPAVGFSINYRFSATSGAEK